MPRCRTTGTTSLWTSKLATVVVKCYVQLMKHCNLGDIDLYRDVVTCIINQP